jgi:hypothetical protein
MQYSAFPKNQENLGNAERIGIYLRTSVAPTWKWQLM